MALISCIECGKEISDKATSCPHCGCVVDKTKFCKFCGEKISADCVICPKCGKQIEHIDKSGNVYINNSASSSSSASATAVNTMPRKEKNKWVAFLLCLFLGFLGAHKFYEGKVGMGILYIFTFGLFGIGTVVDLIILFMKPNPYYV